MEEPLDPKRFHVISKNTQKKVLLFIAIALTVLVPITGYTYYKLAIRRPSQTDKEITFEIKKGDSVFEVSEGLFQKDAINSKLLFILYMYAHRLDRTMQAGNYVIKAGSTIVELGNLFQRGVYDTKITFLEGWRVEEFAREASGKLPDVEYKKFIESAKPYEGYLFPDTYFVKDNITTQDLIALLRDTFDEKTKDILTSEGLSKVGLSKEQAVVFASMVEREASSDSDRKMIAAILIKRWKDGMKLDVDATTQYAVTYQTECRAIEGTCSPVKEDPKSVEWWPSELTKADLEIDSPYNTRKVAGLPPTPISSVSLSSLEAVLNPKESPYYYYLVDSKGVTHYAKTLDDHIANQDRYLTR